MSGCLGFNVVEYLSSRRRAFWSSKGLKSKHIKLANGTTMHCRVYKKKDSTAREKSAVLLIHGFGSDGLTAWEKQINALGKHFDVYIPDLLFFGESTTGSGERSEIFQGECMKAMLEALQVKRVVAVGHSYGGFVAFWMAHRYPQLVRRLVFVSSGVCMTPSTNDSLLRQFGAAHIKEVLLANNLPDFKKTMNLIFYRMPWLPDFLYKDMLEISSTKRDQKAEILDSIVIGSNNSQPLPPLKQDALIVWGEHDRVFSLELAHLLQRHVGEKAKLVVIKKCGHIPSLERPGEFNQALLDYLLTNNSS